MADAIGESIDKTEKLLIDQFNDVIVKGHFKKDKIFCLSGIAGYHPHVVLLFREPHRSRVTLYR